MGGDGALAISSFAIAINGGGGDNGRRRNNGRRDGGPMKGDGDGGTLPGRWHDCDGRRRRLPLSLFLVCRTLAVALLCIPTMEYRRVTFFSRTFKNYHKYLLSDGSNGNFVASHELNCTNDILPIGWCMEEESQTPRYYGATNNTNSRPSRMIRHYTHEGYEHCLAGKTIVFIGDSRVRYQFLNLAHFLKSKSGFMKCEDHPTRKGTIIPDPACIVIGGNRQAMAMVHHDNNVKIWYKNSTDMLVTTDQSHLCDCFRHVPFKPKIERSSENRFIKRSTRFGEINLIYLQAFVDRVTMNKDFPPFSSFLSDGSNINRCGVGECSSETRTIVFTGNVNETLWSILPRLNTTHAFVNFGWTEYDDEAQTRQSAFSCELTDFERHHPNIRTYLISTPPNRKQNSDPSLYFNASKLLKCNCGVLDRSTINQDAPLDWYWDDAHVLGILNEEYNHRMVESICPFVT